MIASFDPTCNVRSVVNNDVEECVEKENIVLSNRTSREEHRDGIIIEGIRFLLDAISRFRKTFGLHNMKQMVVKNARNIMLA